VTAVLGAKLLRVDYHFRQQDKQYWYFSSGAGVSSWLLLFGYCKDFVVRLVEALAAALDVTPERGLGGLRYELTQLSPDDN
jgi:hypothetical protein